VLGEKQHTCGFGQLAALEHERAAESVHWPFGVHSDDPGPPGANEVTQHTWLAAGQMLAPQATIPRAAVGPMPPDAPTATVPPELLPPPAASDPPGAALPISWLPGELPLSAWDRSFEETSEPPQPVPANTSGVAVTMMSVAIEWKAPLMRSARRKGSVARPTGESCFALRLGATRCLRLCTDSAPLTAASYARTSGW
jgi:hypothetical protein